MTDVKQLGRQGARVGVGYVVARIAVFVSTQMGFPELSEIEMELSALVTMAGAWITQNWGRD